MDVNERFRLNAFIERLIDSSGADEEARSAVAEFGRTLNSSSRVEMEATITKPGGTISGQTNESGQVSVKDETPVSKRISHGTGKERIGYYEIWRDQDRRSDWILISHFWKSAVESASETELPQKWALALDREGQPQWFGERGMRIIFTLRFTKAIALEVSREIYPQLWGGGDGQEHRGALVVKLALIAG